MSHFSTISNSTKFIIIVVLCCFRHQNYLFCSIYKIVLFRKRKYTYFTEIFLTCNYILIIDIMCLIIEIFFLFDRTFVHMVSYYVYYVWKIYTLSREVSGFERCSKSRQEVQFCHNNYVQRSQRQKPSFWNFFFNPYAPLRSLFEKSQ